MSPDNWAVSWGSLGRDVRDGWVFFGGVTRE